MLIVVYGLTGHTGDIVNAYFDRIGFQRLKKGYYTSSEKDIKRLLKSGETLLSSRSELEKSYDYVYSINQRLVGFNKKDFDNAVKGNEDLFARLTTTDIDFLKSLKASYGAYVTIVYAYSDDKTLEELVKKYDADERPVRLAIGKELKNTYLNNISLFDGIMIYGGEDSVFDSANLISQLDVIVKKAKSNEVIMNSQRKVHLPYVGTDDYIFVSYAHNDIKRVSETLHMLQRNGFRVWFDEGMRGGENWRKVLREKIKGCKTFILFSSKRAVLSEDVKIEIVTADVFEKEMIVVRLDDSMFKGTIGHVLHSINAISADSETFETKLVNSLPPSTREQKS